VVQTLGSLIFEPSNSDIGTSGASFPSRAMHNITLMRSEDTWNFGVVQNIKTNSQRADSSSKIRGHVFWKFFQNVEVKYLEKHLKPM